MRIEDGELEIFFFKHKRDKSYRDIFDGNGSRYRKNKAASSTIRAASSHGRKIVI